MAEAPRSLILATYRTLTSVAHPLAGLILSWRLKHGKEDPEHQGERYGEASLPRPDGPLVWVHAASVGETMSVLPMIERIIAGGRVSVLLTTGTMTSTRIARARLAAAGLNGRAIHQYVPLDGPRFVRRFLGHWRPGLAIFAESELWPNLILETARSGARLSLVNARMSDRSFRRWQKGPAMIGALLSRFDLCLAQSEGDAERLRALGAEPVICSGNLKYDVPAPEADEAALKDVRAAIGERPRWAAASLHPGEVEAVLDAHASIAAGRPGALTIIAPRHPERGAEMAAAAEARGLTVAVRSRGETPAPDTDIYLFDTIGEMGLVYRLAPIVFMGGSLIPHGGQNPIEPAKLTTAILYGPHIHNFADVYAALHGAGGAEEIADAADLAGKVEVLMTAPAAVGRHAEAANAAVSAFSGALDRSMAALDPLLSETAGGR
ncbi:3-deoxy-D-manno-octulosonic acid transferase [Microbaculum sp. FT89]|uniref:3-deoxy-D-manno-octulosonic acid transferase n=1 Tax=Microbaculum sp. FT89 TaxID=3447298 RepID=UPI003F532824